MPARGTGIPTAGKRMTIAGSRATVPHSVADAIQPQGPRRRSPPRSRSRSAMPRKGTVISRSAPRSSEHHPRTDPVPRAFATLRIVTPTARSEGPAMRTVIALMKGMKSRGDCEKKQSGPGNLERHDWNATARGMRRRRPECQCPATRDDRHGSSIPTLGSQPQPESWPAAALSGSSRLEGCASVSRCHVALVAQTARKKAALTVRSASKRARWNRWSNTSGAAPEWLEDARRRGGWRGHGQRLALVDPPRGAPGGRGRRRRRRRRERRRRA